jgi:Ser/Thr protein kinase RdoA (MazF antagonist)
MDYHTTAAIRSELRWLSALRRDADMPVPEPVPTLDGELSTEVAIPGMPEHRKCSLLRWLNGRFLQKGFRPSHARAWGRLMARLHDHAVHWQRPKGFTRRHNDWGGLFGDDARFEFPASELWEAIPKRFREPFENVTREVRHVMDQLGKGPDVYGLVHADLDVKTNVLFGGGEARVIDFDDSGFAYWLHDLAFALSPWQGSAEQPWVQDSLLEGYLDSRSFPESQLRHLGLFMAAFNATLMLWMIDWAKLCPRRSEPKQYVNKYGSNLMRYYEHH